MRLRALLLLAALAALQAPLAAQEHPNWSRGFGSQSTFDLGQFDSINKFNGNLNVRIPIGFPYPAGGGLSYGLTLHYSGNNWRYSQTGPDSNGQPHVNAHVNDDWNAGFGWLLSLGRIAIPPGWSSLAYQSPDGNWHALYDTLHQYDPQDAGDPGMQWAYTRDGSYLRVKMVPGQPWEVQFPDGAVHKFYSNGQIFALTDRFGNTVNIDVLDPNTVYSPHPNTEWPGYKSWRITDQYGRTHYVHFRPNLYGVDVVGKVDMAGPNNTRAVYRFNYDYLVFSHPCTANPDPNVPQYTTMAVLRGVELPDGSSYASMQYDNGNGGYNCSDPAAGGFTGNLTSVQLPARGKVQWQYRAYQFPGSPETDPYHKFHAAGVGTRLLATPNGAAASVRTYAPLLVEDLSGLYPTWHIVNTITSLQADGTTVISREKHYFSADMYASGGTTRGWYGLPMSRIARAAAANVAPNPDGSSPGRQLSSEFFEANGTLVRSTYLRFEGDDDLWSTGEVNQRVVSERTTYHDDTTCTGGTCFATADHSSFDGLGHYRQTQSSGNFRTAADTRTTFTNFNPARGTFVPTSYPSSFTMLPVSSPWVLETFPEQTVTEGSSTLTTQFCFDANTGFLLRKRTLAGSTPAANDLLSVYTPDSGGNLLREESYGGDVQALGTTDLCTLTLPANQYRIDHTYQYGVRRTSQAYDGAGSPLSFKSADYDVDQYSGLITTSRDSSGLATTYEYDVMGRPLWVKPAQSGWTQYSYVLATSTAAPYVHTRNWNNGATSLLAQSSVETDPWGRTWRENTMAPDGTWSVKETLYNGAGWVSAVSEPRQYGGTSGWTYFQNYDPFGRARTIVPPDGASHTTTIAYAGDRVMTTTRTIGTSRDGSGNIVETSSSRTEMRDRYGRLWQVTEPSGPGGANVTTTYSYDAGGRITQAVTAASEATQTRTFAYDGRGLLLSQSVPEKATATTFGNYDAAGKVGRKSNDAAGVFDILYTYDRAGRVTQVRSSRNSAIKLLKEYTYATANGTVDGVTDYRNGKLATAVRHNWHGTGDTAVTESYFYGGKQGAVSRRTTTASTLSAPTFTQTFTVNDLGQRVTTGYPSCVHSCPGQPARTVSFNYSWGRLGAVIGYAPAITYHPNGLVSQVTHANGVTWNQTIASTNMTRPASIYTSGALNGSGGAADWNSGAYVYDGAGNVVKVGADYFLYDKVSRLVEGTADNNGGATRKQTQTFDSFGNIVSFTTNGTVRNTGAVASTNRLNTHGYDGNGNATSYLSDTYAWDDLDMMLNLSPGTKGWFYLYTADDERIGKYNHLSGHMSWYVRDLDGKVLREYLHSNWRSDGSLGAGSWSWVKDYVYRDGTLLATVDATETRHFHPDHLGTPRLMTNASRLVRSRNDYYAFGQEATSILQNAPNPEERMKFTGHERDLNGPAGTENVDYLDYMHARYYNPVMGRFLSLDPAEPDPAMPQSWNPYAYVLGDPVNATDPTGEVTVRETWNYNNRKNRIEGDIQTLTLAYPPHYIPRSVLMLMLRTSGGTGSSSSGGGGATHAHGGRGGAAASQPLPTNLPQFSRPQRLNNPDYISVSLGAVAVQVDRNARIYLQLSLPASRSASVMFGTFATPKAMDPGALFDAMGGLSVGVGGGSFFGGKASASPRNPVAYEYGLTTPDAQFGGSYTKPLFDCSKGCRRLFW